MLRMPNCPEFIITWLACQKLGVVTVSTMPLLRARELAYIAQDAGTRVAVVASGLREELERARPAAPALERLIVVGEADGPATPRGRRSWTGRPSASRPRIPGPTTWR